MAETSLQAVARLAQDLADQCNAQLAVEIEPRRRFRFWRHRQPAPEAPPILERGSLAVGSAIEDLRERVAHLEAVVEVVLAPLVAAETPQEPVLAPEATTTAPEPETAALAPPWPEQRDSERSPSEAPAGVETIEVSGEGGGLIDVDWGPLDPADDLTAGDRGSRP